MFHCIQGLLYVILYLCQKCRCILVLMFLMLMTPLINLLIKWMFRYIRKPWLGYYCIQYRVSNAYWCITNTWIVYFCDEVCNVSYIWLRWTYLPSTTKVFPFLENGNISTFGYFPPWCQYDCFWWLRKFVCLDVFFTKWKTTSFSCGYRWCFWFLLGSSKWLLLMMTGVATISLSAAGNQFCVGWFLYNFVQHLPNESKRWETMIKVFSPCRWECVSGYGICITFPRDIFVELFICSGSK